MNDDLFPVLEPPRGGLSRLRTRMEQPRRSPLWWATVPALMAAVLLAVIWTQPEPAPLRGDHPALATEGPSVSGRDGTAVQPVSSGEPDVVIYLVSGTRQ